VLLVHLVQLEYLEIQGWLAKVEPLDLLVNRALLEQLEWWELLVFQVIRVIKEIPDQLVLRVHRDQADRQDQRAVLAIKDSRGHREQQVLDKCLLLEFCGESYCSFHMCRHSEHNFIVSVPLLLSSLSSVWIFVTTMQNFAVC